MPRCKECGSIMTWDANAGESVCMSCGWSAELQYHRDKADASDEEEGEEN